MPSSVPAREDVRSPLLTENSRRSGEVWEDATAIARQSDKEGESKSSWYLFLLTLSIGGLQIVWSVELSNGSPYLLSLGMSKSLLAFVWIAGPLTGTLVQPYVGIRSDNCRVPWGKRKPFMIGGGIATVISLMALAWVREMVGGVLGIFGAGAQSEGVKVTTIVVATFFMFCLDFAINTVQAAIRAFIVDNAPAHQQESANAWASRLTGIGNILGYISGYLDLPKVLPFFGNTQFKVLCVIASLALGTTLLISCLYIQERDPRLEGPPRSKNPGVICFFKQVFASIKRLPPQIRKVCEVQLCAWVGWFPFLFYSTTYIGQLYVNPIFDQHPDLPEDAISAIWEEATRVGTFALLAYAVTSFVASMVLPLLVVPTYRPALAQDSDTDTTSSDRPYLSRHPSTSTLSFTASAGAAIETSHEPVQPSEKYNVLSKLQIPGLTLRRLWFLSHVLFSLCMFSTFLIYSPQAGTVVIAIVGISWALTLWAPFAFISAEVAKSDAENRERRHQLRQGIPDLSHGHPGSECDENGSSEETVDQAGVILGIHNVAISFPQIASTLISSAIFKALQKPRGEPWDDSVGWVLRFGGCAALGAAYITTRLGEGAGGKTSGENGDMA
ncbi:general alpha-glucoside permease, putative [Coccidioides posadasii C735 delta SOWgp]|uniref:Sucrose transport protein n=2 Tax=Coccidioides posadasii TaxID=199306 RepID=A0A0J6F2D5_COCPO|nr:general alpha-glucoside permease, putative [Coccidioides posadasii C735 delta SOWgp]EER27286.1 general alpha-glucoside permease, putative [Coccidioides posadasii C735 delta SOWgp]KMM67056.1 sucrose transport protein [Coccidioides posadasii RMSCC 3488]|eukprot:XP_003069431.1 general alpha-glucoside permease, putative [Coccidioides posadasii C735 delta SOWgp]